MLLSIISIIANIAYTAVLNIAFYTDRAMMPDGHYREWHRSPVSRLSAADESWLYHLQIILVAISIVSSVLVLIGVKNRTVRIVQTVSLIASTVMFVIIMIVTNNIHVHYA
ncbi:MAG: hypothetical protein J5528_05225 [Firmicutes bacterium]|nr:hypothetical protein [Bacillota bacterium]